MITHPMDVFKNIPSDLKGLNEKQREAVQIVDGPSIILAGAGSGKTRVLIHKVLHLIQDKKVDPRSIVMITFTNKAAREMKERILHAVSNSKLALRFGGLGYIGTYHSFCCLILRRDGEEIEIPHTFTIYDDDDAEALLKKIIKDSISGKSSSRYFSNRISEAKNQLVEPDRYLELFSYHRAAQVADVYYQYQKQLKKNNALDFDDLIMKAVELFTKAPEILDKYQNRYRHLLVDEFQDTNNAQYVFTRLLAKKYQNITVVGDFSQSIYSWRGADIRNLEKFSEDFSEAKVVELEQNYRSSQNILDFAYEVISENQLHPILKLFTKNDDGEEVILHETDNEEEEAYYVTQTVQNIVTEDDYSQIAILYRTNAQSRLIEEAFLHETLPYTLIGGTRFYERKEIKDILSYLRLLIHPTDEIALDRVKKIGKQRFSKFKSFYESYKSTKQILATAELMEEIFNSTGYLELYDPDIPEDYARIENIKELKSVAMNFPDLVNFLEQVALVESEYFESEKKGNSGSGVRLMTLHQAKGLEFDHVFIVGLEEGILPHSRSIDDNNQLEEERRLFYVGITRARKKLYITHTKMRSIFGRRNYAVKSRFIRKEGESVEEWW